MRERERPIGQPTRINSVAFALARILIGIASDGAAQPTSTDTPAGLVSVGRAIATRPDQLFLIKIA
jgi:hypothetical protein